MRIRMRTRYAGPFGVCHPGLTIELPDADGRDLIEKGFATEERPANPNTGGILKPEPVKKPARRRRGTRKTPARKSSG